MAPIARTDAGIAAQTIMLGATQAGFGGCMLASVAPDLLDALGVRCVQGGKDVGLQLLLVLALGKPAEKVVLEPVGSEHGTTYWRDADGRTTCPSARLPRCWYRENKKIGGDGIVGEGKMSSRDHPRSFSSWLVPAEPSPESCLWNSREIRLSGTLETSGKRVRSFLSTPSDARG